MIILYQYLIIINFNTITFTLWGIRSVNIAQRFNLLYWKKISASLAEKIVVLWCV